MNFKTILFAMFILLSSFAFGDIDKSKVDTYLDKSGALISAQRSLESFKGDEFNISKKGKEKLAQIFSQTNIKNTSYTIMNKNLKRIELDKIISSYDTPLGQKIRKVASKQMNISFEKIVQVKKEMQNGKISKTRVALLQENAKLNDMNKTLNYAPNAIANFSDKYTLNQTTKPSKEFMSKFIKSGMKLYMLSMLQIAYEDFDDEEIRALNHKASTVLSAKEIEINHQLLSELFAQSLK